MAQYQVTGPDGSTYTITAPDDATQDQVLSYAQANFGQQPRVASTGQVLPSDQQLGVDPTTGIDKFGRTTEQRQAILAKANNLEQQAQAPYIPQSTGDWAGDVELGAWHHLGNAALGAAQGLGHLIGAGADAVMSPDNPVRQAIDGTNANADQYIHDREAEYQKVVPNDAAVGIGAAAGEIAPWLIGAGEARAAGMLPQATSWLGKLGQSALAGGAQGALQPVTNAPQNGLGQLVSQSPSYADQKAKQIGIGAGTGAGLNVLGSLASGAKGLAQHIFAPQTVADANVANLYGANQQTVDALRNAPQYVPNEVPTPAQVVPSPQTVSAERMLRNNPATKEYFAAQDNANNQARQQAVSGIAGTPQDIQDAIASRRAATQPFIDQNLTSANRVDPTAIQQSIAQTANSSLGMNPTVAKALKAIGTQISDNTDQNGTIGADLLDGIRQNASRILADNHVPNRPVGTQEEAGIAPVKNQIVDSLEQAIPGYKGYLQNYADLSTPINTMSTVQNALNNPNLVNSLNSGGDSQLGIVRINKLLRDDDNAQYPMDPAARAKLEAIRDSLQRRSISDNKIAASGPGTAPDLQAQGPLASAIFGSSMGAKGGPVGRSIGGAIGAGLGGMIGGPVGAAVGLGAGGGISDALGALNNRVLSRVGQTASNSQATADAIQRYLEANKANPVAQWLYRAAQTGAIQGALAPQGQ